MKSIPWRTLRILFTAGLLFAVFNALFALIPSPAIWDLSLYNVLLPGRPRFQQEDDLDLVFRTHEISASPARPDEFKVAVLGHSSTWGYLLESEETFSGVINAAGLETCQGKPIRLYNLAFPKLSVFKDLLILDRSMHYQPDMILWMVTLNSTLREPKQHPIITYNGAQARALSERYGLGIQIETEVPSLSRRTFLARRQDLARFAAFELEGFHWMIAGEVVKKKYTPIGQAVQADQTFGGIPPDALDPSLVMVEVMQAGTLRAGEIPVFIVNEPIQVVTGENSQVRYNEHYPRWAYDQYRTIMDSAAARYGWHYVDLWNIVPPTEFSDSAVHRTPAGEKLVAQAIRDILLQTTCP